ncbi:MAG: hypothetical protein AB7F19_07705 [Candidatus Babeliales bacterium]
MSWNGSGIFNILFGDNKWQNDRDQSIPIQAAPHDARDQDMAAGINNCLTKDGQNAATANLPMGGFRHTNVGTASSRNQYAVVSQVQDSKYIYGGTSTGSSNTYEITLTPAISAYAAGQKYHFLSHQANSGAATLAINGLAATAITKNGAVALVGGEIPADAIIQVTYDGTQFQLTAVAFGGGDFLPDTDATYSLGSAAKRWVRVILSTGARIYNGATNYVDLVAATLTGNRTATFPDVSGNVILDTSSTFAPVGTNAGDAARIALLELAANGTNAVTIKGPDSTAGYSMTIPAAQGAAGQSLINNGSGILSWGAGGKIVQVVSAIKTDTFTQNSITAGTYYDVTGLAVSITPTSASSTVLILGMVSCGMSADAVFYQVTRGGTPVAIGDAAGSRSRSHGGAYATGTGMESGPILFLDSPATTSSTTYQVQIGGQQNGTNIHVNRSNTDTNTATFVRGASTLFAVEIAA